MNITSSNISLRKINNNFKKDISLTDTVNQIKNNNTLETLSINQNITVREPIDFNNGALPNTDAIEFVEPTDLISRYNYNSDSRKFIRFRDIYDSDKLFINGNAPYNILSLILASYSTKTSIDVLNTQGEVIKSISSINDIMYSKNIIDYIITNIDNDFEGTALDNYSVIQKNQIPLSITGNQITIKDSITLDNVIIAISDIEWDKVFSLYKDGINKVQKLEIGIRFNVDNTIGFPIRYPFVNTNFSKDQILSDAQTFIFYIRSGKVNILDYFDSKKISSIFLYF